MSSVPDKVHTSKATASTLREMAKFLAIECNDKKPLTIYAEDTPEMARLRNSIPDYLARPDTPVLRFLQQNADQ